MNKLPFIIAVLTLLTGLSSCPKEREGKYTPKEKVQSVYQEQTWYQNDEVVRQEAKYKSEEWTWANDQLDSIIYYEQHTYQSEDETEIWYEKISTQQFTYDKDGRLTKSEIVGYFNIIGFTSIVATCEYDGKYLKSITVTEEGEFVESYQFNHNGKQITSFDLTLSNNLIEKDKKAMQLLDRVNPLRFILDVEIATKVMSTTQECVKRASKADIKANNVVHFDMTWEGDNVSRIAGNYMGPTMQYDITYDNKNNPFYNLFDIANTVYQGFLLSTPICKHNVTGISLTLTGSEGETSRTKSVAITYTYNNKDYPTSRTQNTTDGDDGYEQTYYYEYK